MVSHLFVQVENPARANTPETKRLVRSHISSLQHERNRHLYCRHPPRRKKPLNHVRDVHDQASDQSEPSKLPLLVNDDIVCNLGHVTVSHHNKQSQAYRTVRNGPVLALHLSPKDPTDELAKLIMGTGISFSSICVRDFSISQHKIVTNRSRDSKLTWQHLWVRIAIRRICCQKARCSTTL
jgi:hypothetical protein